MPKSVIFHPEARDDIREIAARYAEISEQVHDRFWNELDHHIARIEKYPESGHPDPSGFRRQNLKRFPYHILYFSLPTESRIMVIRHDHRNPTYGIDRK